MIEIPLTSDSSQTLSIEIQGVVYDLRILYNSRISLWEMDISQNGADLVSGIGLVGGVDLLEQYTLPIKNMYLINTANPKEEASFDNLGSETVLIVYDEGELQNA